LKHSKVKVERIKVKVFATLMEDMKFLQYYIHRTLTFIP